MNSGMNDCRLVNAQSSVLRSVIPTRPKSERLKNCVMADLDRLPAKVEEADRMSGRVQRLGYVIQPNRRHRRLHAVCVYQCYEHTGG